MALSLGVKSLLFSDGVGHCGWEVCLVGGGSSGLSLSRVTGEAKRHVGCAQCPGWAMGSSVWYGETAPWPRASTLLLLWVLPLHPIASSVPRFLQVGNCSGSCPDHLT